MNVTQKARKSQKVPSGAWDNEHELYESHEFFSETIRVNS